MSHTRTRTSPPGDPQQLCEGWEVLRETGFERTSRLPYFRSLSRAPSEIRAWRRFVRGERDSPRAAWPPLYYRAFARGDPELFALFQLFSLGHPISLRRFRSLVSPRQLQELQRSGFVRFADESVLPLVRIFFRGPQVFLHDPPGVQIGLAERAYLARDSLRFADYLLSSMGRPRARALDIGTGAGVQAITLAAYAERVVALERNPRALSFAQANAHINGVENVRFVLGDIVDAPLASDRSRDAGIGGPFDLVVSNPPFLHLPHPLPEGPDPASDGGHLGITLPRRILARLEGLLSAGGEARILVSLPRPRGRNGLALFERWMERTLVARGLNVRLRFVEYLWREDQAGAYEARGLATPSLVVAEVGRSERPRLTVTRAPVAEELILARRQIARRIRIRTARLHRYLGPGLARRVPGLLRRRSSAAGSLFLRPDIVTHPPLHLAIEPTTTCSLDCVSCARSERIAAEERMETGLLARLIASTHPESVRFYGSGEPLEHPEIERLCRLAGESGAHVSLMTHLAEETCISRAERCLPHLSRIIVGFDAADPETYGRIRRNGDFERAGEGVRRLLRSRSRRARSGPEILISFLILGLNVGEISDFVGFAAGLGADGALFLPLDGLGIENRLTQLRGRIDPEVLRIELERIEERAARLGIWTNLSSLRESQALLAHGYAEAPPVGNGICPRPWLSTYVRANGDVRPCARYAYGREAHLGNLGQEDWKTLWNGPEYRRLRELHRNHSVTLSPCRCCPVPATESRRWPTLSLKARR